jgi:hypothetical protein
MRIGGRFARVNLRRRQPRSVIACNSKRDARAGMIDNFSLGLTHALMLYAAWRLLRRPDLDTETAPEDQPRGWGKWGKR